MPEEDTNDQHNEGVDQASPSASPSVEEETDDAVTDAMLDAEIAALAAQAREEDLPFGELQVAPAESEKTLAQANDDSQSDEMLDAEIAALAAQATDEDLPFAEVSIAQDEKAEPVEAVQPVEAVASVASVESVDSVEDAEDEESLESEFAALVADAGFEQLHIAEFQFAIPEVEAQIEKLEAQISQLESEAPEFESAVPELELDPEELESAITELVSETAELESEIPESESETPELEQVPVQELVSMHAEVDLEAFAQTEEPETAETTSEDDKLDAEIAALAAQARAAEIPDDDLVDLPDMLDVEASRPQLEQAFALDPLAKYEAILNGPPQETGGIEILIQMAAKGEIDPKNIDIIDVTDRFLRAISAVPKENLRQSGKIIFQASVLLRMKAEHLLVTKLEDELGFGDDYVDFDIDGSPLIYDSNHQIIGRQITLADLERALTRQTKLRQLRHRRVTLEQLIEALREAERLEATRGDRKIKARIALDGYSEMRDMDDILDLAHDEDIEDVIARIERLLIGLLEENKLLPLLAIIEALGGRGDWVDAFLAVLFLSNAGKITLEQEEFYGTLFIAPSVVELGTIIPPTVPTSAPPMTH